uniref:Uncharacterized protein n=1 Tax=Myotis myotis TaxID=51298 RepID=A0A7J7VZ98_MYOMY|nr:hypothetical protein mMyoMyo1_012311 [Myotis myotis]
MWLPLPRLSHGPMWLLEPSGLPSNWPKGQRGRKRKGTLHPLRTPVWELQSHVCPCPMGQTVSSDYTVPERRLTNSLHRTRPRRQPNSRFPLAKKENGYREAMVMLITLQVLSLDITQGHGAQLEMREPGSLGSALPLTSQVVLGNLLNFSVPQFPCL